MFSGMLTRHASMPRSARQRCTLASRCRYSASVNGRSGWSRMIGLGLLRSRASGLGAAELHRVAPRAVAVDEALPLPLPHPAGALAAAVGRVQVAAVEVEPDLVAEHLAVAAVQRRGGGGAAAVEVGGETVARVRGHRGRLCLAPDRLDGDD